MATKMLRASVRLDADTIKDLDRFAERDGSSRAKLVRTILEETLLNAANSAKLLAPAEEDILAGRTRPLRAALKGKRNGNAR
jgi:hypothetical protein